MPKLKTRKALAKRIRVTSNGKLIRDNARKSHRMWSKSKKRKRGYNEPQNVHPGDVKQVRRSLGV